MELELSDVYVKKERRKIKFVVVELKEEGKERGLKVFISGKYLKVDGWEGKDEEGYGSVWECLDVKLEMLKRVRLELEENIDSLLKR